MLQKRLYLASVLLCLATGAAGAGEADVVAVEVEQSSPGVYAFQVTVAHADEGWEHYADRWEVIAPDGRVLATRVLAHPHVDEQPFTRGLTAVAIAPDIHEVEVRSHDSVHGWAGATMQVRLPD